MFTDLDVSLVPLVVGAQGRRVSLFRDAQRFPASLHGSRVVVPAADLRLTTNAARWRAGRDSGLARLHRGVYLVGAMPIDLLDRVHAALAVSPPGAAVGYHTAAALLGFGVVASEAVHIVVPGTGTFPQRPGITVHRSALPVVPITVMDVPCTAPARTAVDLARTLPRPDGLSFLDAALAAGACEHAQLLAESLVHKRLRGCVKAQDLVPLADGRAECAQESHLRLILRDGGIDSLEPQVPVWDGDDWPRYILDLADTRRKVAAEYDGSSHLDRARMGRDRERHNYLAGIGWRMRYFTSHDLYRRPNEIVRILKAVLSTASAS